MILEKNKNMLFQKWKEQFIKEKQFNLNILTRINKDRKVYKNI